MKNKTQLVYPELEKISQKNFDKLSEACLLTEIPFTAFHYPMYIVDPEQNLKLAPSLFTDLGL
jgi:hypothetical protein